MPVRILQKSMNDIAAASALVVPVYRTGSSHLYSRVSKAVMELIDRLRAASGIDGEIGSVAAVTCESRLLPPIVVFTGIASRAEAGNADLADSYAAGVRKAALSGCSSVALLAGSLTGSREAAITGAAMGSLYFSRKQKPRRQKLREAIIVCGDGPLPAADLKKFAAIATAHARAFELVNSDGASVTPERLAEEARGLARNPRISAAIWDHREIVKRGMGLLAAVGRSSANRPKFIHLEYSPGKAASGHLAVVGKGITFDTGGIDLKRYPGLPTMKGDMGGAAAVLGLFHALPDLAPPMRISGLIPAAENSFGGNSYKPGDVYKSMSGRHVEVGDTDAEGRLVLADAIHYATTLKPDAIVDLATLTGSCVVGLGEDYAGLFSTSDRLAGDILDAGSRAFERFWQMPLPAGYRRHILSPIADLKNVASTRYGDAIMAALFLREFTDGLPWAHLDIAGPSWYDDDQPGYPGMGTGFGVRTLCRLVEPANWRRGRFL